MEEVTNNLSKCLTNIANGKKNSIYLVIWLNVNRLSLNIDKTNFTIFHPYNKPLEDLITIKINKKAIVEKQFIKYLGVIIDSSLSWKYHISNISKKISRAIGIMYKLSPYLHLNGLKNVYYSLIYSDIVFLGFSF